MNKTQPSSSRSIKPIGPMRLKSPKFNPSRQTQRITPIQSISGNVDLETLFQDADRRSDDSDSESEYSTRQHASPHIESEDEEDWKPETGGEDTDEGSDSDASAMDIDLEKSQNVSTYRVKRSVNQFLRYISAIPTNLVMGQLQVSGNGGYLGRRLPPGREEPWRLDELLGHGFILVNWDGV
ncbi:hypothetical protein BDN72DRAFT_907324 [Pluteus cervinus]|uniref:Uncharacterized protein n=1 Tax=Pluteus cervinus TaxID=181527 RepID=A0ACD2ZWY6_9AGAR|nr:hypothetical protein BDN72DRAFT_907324 [Pluteus cervinus]